MFEIIAKIFGIDLGTTSTPKKPKNAKKQHMTLALPWRILLSVFSTAVIGFLVFYIALPPLNLHSFSFYLFVIFLCVVFSLFMKGLGDYEGASLSKGKFITPYFKNTTNSFIS